MRCRTCKTEFGADTPMYIRKSLVETPWGTYSWRKIHECLACVPSGEVFACGKCPTCKREVSVSKGYKDFYCSPSCRRRGRYKPVIQPATVCARCGGVMIPKRKTAKFCGVACRVAAHRAK